MAVFAQDDFDGESVDIVLSSHTPDVGGSWVEHPNYTQDLYCDADGYARGTSNTVTGYYYNNGVPSGAEYDVQADLYDSVNDDTGFSGLTARINTTINTRYQIFFNGVSNLWSLHKTNAGVSTELGTYTGDDIYLTTRTVKFEIRDATKKLIIDSVERISSADNAITAAGKAGIRARTNGRIDNFVATDLTGGGLSIPVAMAYYRQRGN